MYKQCQVAWEQQHGTMHASGASLVGDRGCRQLEQLNIAARLWLVAGAGHAILLSQGMHHLPLVARHSWQALPFAALSRKEACQLAFYALDPLFVGPGMGQQHGAVRWSPAV